MNDNTRIVEASSLDKEKTMKRMNWGTLDYFLDFRAVRIIGFVALLVYVLIIILSLSIPNAEIVLPSIAELVSVFVGITLGFYWNIANETRKDSIEYRRIFRRFIEELTENMKRLDFIYSERYNINLILLLKTNTWEISVDRLRDINIKEMYDVEDIYHRLKVINQYIEHYPTTEKIPKNDLDYVVGIVETVKEKIPGWINTINSIYGWD